MEGERAAHFIGYPGPPRFTSIKAIYFHVKTVVIKLTGLECEGDIGWFIPHLYLV